MNARFKGYAYSMLALLFGVAACSTDGTTASETQESFDVVTAQAGLNAVDAATATAVWESFGVLGQRLDTSTIANGFLAALSEVRDLSSGGRSSVNDTDDSPIAAPRIPDETRGTTFVFDPDEGRYVADLDRTDAPDNGIRFILYAVNPITGEPVVSDEIGYADLTDLDDETDTGFTLRFQVVSDGVTYLDYTVSQDGTETSGSLEVSGFVSNGTEQIELEVDVAATNEDDATTQDVTFHINAADHLSAAATVHGSSSAAGSMGDVDLVVTVDETEIALDVHGQPNRIDAIIAVNGDAFATVSGVPHHPDIRSADGRPLRPDERQALHRMLQLVDNVFRMFNHLMQPVGHIVGLSGIQL